MKFIPLKHEDQLSEIKEAKGCNLIFKHNTTCSISRGVHSRLEEENPAIPGVESIYLLDLLEHRHISDAVANDYGVAHQSPQLLLIQNGRCTYHEWGYDISAETAAKVVKQ